MRAIQKLTRNGDSTAVTIPVSVMRALDWLPGDAVIVEVTLKRTVEIRRPRESDFRRTPSPRLVLDQPDEVKA